MPHACCAVPVNLIHAGVCHSVQKVSAELFGCTCIPNYLLVSKVQGELAGYSPAPKCVLMLSSSPGKAFSLEFEVQLMK